MLQLSSEYEALISEHGTLKSQYKQLKEEMTVVVRSKEVVAREKAAVEELRQSIQKERMSIQLDDSYTEDIKRLNEEKQVVQQQADKVCEPLISVQCKPRPPPHSPQRLVPADAAGLLTCDICIRFTYTLCCDSYTRSCVMVEDVLNSLYIMSSYY